MLAGSDHDEGGDLGARPAALWLGLVVEERDGKCVATGGESFTAADFEAGLWIAGRKEMLQGIFISAATGLVREQGNAGFRIPCLPGLEKSVGGGESGGVITIDWRGRGARLCP